MNHLSKAMLPLAAVPALGTVPAAAQAGSPAQRPNIVAIVADDLLTTELGCYGGRNIDTPNIDRIAAEGVQFTHCYASVAMSVPIRASMYTGLYPARHGSYMNHKETYQGTRTVNDYMPQEGYRVGRTGKDHPGPKSVYVFDEIPGFTVNCVAKEAPYTVDGIREWISRGEDPFLLYVCSINTHAPWTWGDPSEFDADKIILPENCVQNAQMREIFTHYLAELRALDNEVGSVLKVLEETGKLDNTLVMFLGEQGPQFPGGKWTLWYPGCHSALLARWPGRIRPGSRSDALVQYEDLLPTFIDIAGGAPRPELDGVSFKKALLGEGDSPRKYVYGMHNNNPEGHRYPIRSIRDDRYALILNLMPDSLFHEKHLMRSDGPTKVWDAWLAGREESAENAFWFDRYIKRPAVEFYDLKKDPWEKHNLAGKRRYAKRIARMKAELLSWMEQQGDTGIQMDHLFKNRTEQLREKIDGRKEAVLVKDGWIRDPFVVLGPDKYFYLCGTTHAMGDPRARTDSLNTGLGKKSIVGGQFRLWRSLDMVNWQDMGAPYQVTPTGKGPNDGVLWAPEMQWTGTNWVMVHCPGENSELLVSEGPSPRGTWRKMDSPDFRGRHDPSLFQDRDGRWYMTFGFRKFFVAELKPDFSGFAHNPVEIGPADRLMGHEGTVIRRIGDKYVLFGTAWSTDQMRKGSYNLYYCTADNIYGPYSERRFAGRFLGHGTPFQDKRGRWWCTAFYNADRPVLDTAGIATRDLREAAQTINRQGTTLVPLQVQVLPDGDVRVRALDPAYAVPGPDEVQVFTQGR